MSTIEGEPRYSHYILLLFMAICNLKGGAKQLAQEDLMAMFCNNPLTQELELGNVNVEPDGAMIERISSHCLWCLILDISGSLVSTLAINSSNPI
jgi:hypothetical protein